ncbi:MAG TPA: maleylpyruvate isomerase family mycothiol-dependent enzyme [Propioniciclava tarda]|nr:maleylpyruvate isomerase family mycothiol-dependent enzyme [Propioniciclava tarda]
MDHLTIIDAETERFIEAVAAASGEGPVPTCPDWTVDDLLWHLTEVHAFWARILSSGARTDADSEAVEADKPERPVERGQTVELLRAETAALVAELRSRPDADPAWSWFPPDQTVGFTRRMQVHEATMHRIDAELAAGLVSRPIEHEVASDGVSHAVEVMLGWWGTNPGFELRPVTGVVELVASDGGRWLLQPGRWIGTGQSGKTYDEPGVVLVADGEPAASITATADTLDRWLWGRGPEPEASGDQESLDALRAAVAPGMQ